MLQRIIHAIVYAAIRAYFDAVRDAKLAHEEQPTDIDRARADRFRAAVGKLRTGNADAGDTGPVNSAPYCESCDCQDFCPHAQRHDAADGTGPRRVVDSESTGSRGKLNG